ncbi:hypothetical protein RHGRI_029490 [Rhododendron griersonianum]|uniref:Ribosomal protein S14 n=1 Tax=Rhododendron griersonianum TaxID=479676 RepID=A0AAV6IQF6_9ERIC|nr:hypothetical protein RHGRI_029490 [Rhododendron griersonianum]
MRTLRPPMLGRKGQRRRQRWMQKRHPCMTHSGIIRRKAVRHFLRSPIQRSSTFSCLICLRHTPLLYRRKRMSTRFTAYPRTTDKLGSRPY